MRVRVVHIVNGTTSTDEFEAHRVAGFIAPNGHGAGKVTLYDEHGVVVKWKLYAHCETIEPIEGDE